MEVKKVAIFGYASIHPSDEEYFDVRETAKLLAENGYVIVNGGGPGAMEAATIGAHEGHGKSIGVILDGEQEHMTTFEGADAKNNIDEKIICRTYVERTLKMMEIADVYVIFNGGTGTISEFGMAWGLARLHFGHHKPLILFGSFWHEVIEAIGKNMKLRPEEMKVYHIVTSPEEVLMKIKTIEASDEHDFLKTST